MSDSTALAKTAPVTNTVPTDLKEKVARVLAYGDLGKLDLNERAYYITKVCESMGLNPLTSPIKIQQMDGKWVMYATKDCTEQLRKIHGVSVTELETEVRDDVYVVKAHVVDKTGRQDQDMGAVYIGGLKGLSLANAWKKATTQAKRRATLSVCGMGILDESELEDIEKDQRKSPVKMPLKKLPPGFEPESEPEELRQLTDGATAEVITDGGVIEAAVVAEVPSE